VKAPWRRSVELFDENGPTVISRLLADPDVALPDAGPEVEALQQALRESSLRRAHLASVTATISKASHDARGVLSPALLAAERLQGHDDPAVQRTAQLLLASIERVTELLRSTVEFARARQPPATNSRFPLRVLIEEAAARGLAGHVAPAMLLHVPADLQIEADRDSLGRVISNVLRNAIERGATEIRLAAATQPGLLKVEVADNGPVLQADASDPMRQSPRGGTDQYGLAVARELLIAGGGDLELVETAPEGTIFRIKLPFKERPGGHRA
jgi:signal transduction histidine kinase